MVNLFIRTSILLGVVLWSTVHCQHNWFPRVFCNPRYDARNPCSFECLYGNANTVGSILEKLSHENNLCRYGMIVRLDHSLMFDDRIIRSRWFNAEVRILEMEMLLDNVLRIESYAFDSAAFKSIKTLTLSNLNIKKFEANTFHGLTQLKTLRLYQLRTRHFPPGWLDDVAGSLEYLLVYGGLVQPYNVNGLTNGANMSHLRLATYGLNLMDSIEANSFTGLTSILTLELTSCSIETIGPGAFDPLAASLKLLKLNNNKIKILPAGIFDQLLPSSTLSIYLSPNPFDCTCHLNDFQQTLIKHRSNFIGSPKCSSPYYMSNLDVNLIEFCIDGTDKSMMNNVYLRCFDANNSIYKTFVERRKQQFRLILNEHGVLALHQFRTSPQPLILIGSKYLINKTITEEILPDKFGCVWNPRPLYHVSTGKGQTSLYALCVMDPNRTTVSPLDCSSYLHRNMDFRRIWLHQIDKQSIVARCGIITVLSFVVGIFVGFLLRMFRIGRTTSNAPENEYVETSDLYEESSSVGQSVNISRSNTYRISEGHGKHRWPEDKFDDTYVYQSKFDIVPEALAIFQNSAK